MSSPLDFVGVCPKCGKTKVGTVAWAGKAERHCYTCGYTWPLKVLVVVHAQ